MTTAIPSVVSTLVTLSSEGFTLPGWFCSLVLCSFVASAFFCLFVWFAQILKSKGGDYNG